MRDFVDLTRWGIEYQDFVVQIGAGRGGGLAARVLASPAGEGEATFRLPASSDEWLRVRAELCRRGRHLLAEREASASPAPRQVGETLFRTLFTGEVSTLFAASRGIVAQQGQGLRLRLRFRLDPADPRLTLLHELPWEFLCDPGTRDFLALSRQTPIVRSLDVPRSPAPLPLPGGPRILVATADDPAHPLDLESERRFLEEVWAGIPGVEILDLDRTGIAGLREALLASPIHILHLMGHGEIDVATRAGVVVLTGLDGSRLPVSGETLGNVLKDFPSLRLVFLNACDTGRIPVEAEPDPFTGVATALVLGGVPAVVAMQLPVADDAAIAFSRTVYGRLAQGDPIDAAVTEGRHAIHALYPGSGEWAIPILFLRTADGRILAPTNESEAAPGPTGPEVAPAVRPPRRGWPRLLAAGAAALVLAGLAALVLWNREPRVSVERVWLGRFWIARHEVSNRDYLRFVKETPEWRRGRIRREYHDGEYLAQWISPTEYPSGLSDHPVTQVSWFAARAYCAWAGGELPTMAEWKQAAHAAESVYPWGPDLSGPARLNFCDAACQGEHRGANPGVPERNDGFPGTAPVTAFPRGSTRDGVYNLSGNVWEWCLDASEGGRMTMGGSYDATFEECTTDVPAWEEARLCALDGGFRCIWRPQ